MLQMVLGFSALHQYSSADGAHLHHFPCINLARVSREAVEVGIKGSVRSWRMLSDRRGPGWRGADKWQIGAVCNLHCLRSQSVVCYDMLLPASRQWPIAPECHRCFRMGTPDYDISVDLTLG